MSELHGPLRGFISSLDGSGIAYDLAFYTPQLLSKTSFANLKCSGQYAKKSNTTGVP